MSRRIKELICFYVCIVSLIVCLTVYGAMLKSCQSQMAQSQETVQEQQEKEVPIIQDKSVDEGYSLN